MRINFARNLPSTSGKYRGRRRTRSSLDARRPPTLGTPVRTAHTVEDLWNAGLLGTRPPPAFKSRPRDVRSGKSEIPCALMHSENFRSFARSSSWRSVTSKHALGGIQVRATVCARSPIAAFTPVTVVPPPRIPGAMLMWMTLSASRVGSTWSGSPCVRMHDAHSSRSWFALPFGTFVTVFAARLPLCPTFAIPEVVGAPQATRTNAAANTSTLNSYFCRYFMASLTTRSDCALHPAELRR